MWCELYDIEREMGRGRFGVVVQAVGKATGDHVAIKVVGKTTKEKTDACTINREVQALRIAKGHPCLLQLLDVMETATQVALILELVRGGELFDYLAKKDTFEEEEAVVFTNRLLDGLAYLHYRNVVHLDIKPENILLVDEGSVGLIKIIDFGLARVLNNEPQFETHGTIEFVAPEVVNHKPVTTSADMWAVGVITYILLSGLSPFLGETDDETLLNIVNTRYNINEDFEETEVTLEAKDFIESLLVKDFRERFTAEQCLRHPWIRLNEVRRRSSLIRTQRLRTFNARRKWNSAFQAVQALSYVKCLSLNRKQKLQSFSSVSSGELPPFETEESDSSCVASEMEADVQHLSCSQEPSDSWKSCVEDVTDSHGTHNSQSEKPVQSLVRSEVMKEVCETTRNCKEVFHFEN